ncbi:c-type cytochrome [Candidatus Nitrosacidococcus sp. I8]|uniref:c-type cytochrome n=1 Tax=Candidatus Nitrosacidococcus sp. I8 TaxID=2942908 RepID=UPI002227A6E1|nr:c-type cytochrome [Candidatus Nitrosacidococcus sp. I8]CAH9014748.1 Cytochrome c6 [Candidatus Nitrosacidococcus sp. I8]
MLRNIFFALVGVTALTLTSTSVLAADAGAGKDAYVKNGCAACHGSEGQSVNAKMFPVLKDKDASFIVEQLHAFKSGARVGKGAGVIMNAKAKALSDDDIANIAAFVTGG